jgi:hypothetical protein
MARTPGGWRERLGEVIGRAWAPAVRAIGRLRGGRALHPEGHTFTGRAIAIPGPFGSIGEQLAGRVLARCSPALSRRGRARFDVLGLALRFRPGPGAPLDHEPSLGDQDLLFATCPSPLALPLSLLFADVRDYVSARYWAISPFAIHDRGRVELRLTPIPAARRARAGAAPRAASRELALREAVRAGDAAWWLEARRTLTPHWYRVARISLERAAAVDDRALRFDPFRAGCGVMPVGFVHALRRATYAAGQRARA